MRAKLSGWRHVAYAVAVLAAFALAAGARFKPN
jgi:anti-sigma-K factor RskA